jgi:multicomponent K+:H+ antiporter subunit A
VVGGDLPPYSLAIWHGLNMPFAMSLVALAGGSTLYALLRWQRAKGAVDAPPLMHRLDGQWLFEKALTLISLGARAARRALGTRRLQWQMLWLVAAAVAASTTPLWLRGLHIGNRAGLPLSPIFALLWAIGCVCAVAAAWQAKYHRLAALTLLSAAGLCVCVTFLWFSAPDLALTQIVVEVVTTLLILLGLRWLPKRNESLRTSARGPQRRVQRRAQWRRWRDLALALTAGAGMTALSLAMMSRPFPESTSTFFLERALTEGGGTNVVNVMLVDFRGFDTFGEIVVLGIVALTVYALLRRFRPAREVMDLPAQQRALPADVATDLANPRQTADTAIGYLTVPAVLVRLLLPFATLVAQRTRWRLCSGAGVFSGLAAAIHCLGHHLGGSASGAVPPPVDRHRHAGGTGHGPGLMVVWLPLLDQPHRAPALACGGRRSHRQRAVF